MGVVFIGVGLYWLRGAFATVTRHEERLSDGDSRAAERNHP